MNMLAIMMLIGLNSGDMPQIPFEVYDPVMKRTIHVKGGCNSEPGTLTLLVSEHTFPILNQVRAAVTRAFRTEGVTIVYVCRK